MEPTPESDVEPKPAKQPFFAGFFGCLLTILSVWSVLFVLRMIFLRSVGMDTIAIETMFVPEMLAVLPVLTILVFVLFLLIGFPLWCLIDCVRSQKFSAEERTSWILTLIFTNFVGGFFYALRKADSPFLRQAGRLSLIPLTFAVPFLLYCNQHGAHLKSGFKAPEEIKLTEHADPVRDLANAKARGDYTYRAVEDITSHNRVIHFPGLTQEQADLIDSPHMCPIVNSTGIVDTPAKKKLHELDIAYVAKYNTLLQKSTKTAPGSTPRSS